MADSRTITINLKAVSDFNDVVSNAKQIQTVLNKLKLPESLKGNFDKIFGDIEKYGNKAAESVAKGFKTKGDLSGFEKSVNSVSHAWEQLLKNLNRIDDNILKDSLDIDTSKLKEAEKEIEKYKQLISTEAGSKGLSNIESTLSGLVKQYGKVTGSAQEFINALKSGDIEKATKEYQKFSAAADKIKDDNRRDAYVGLAKSMQEVLKALDTDKVKGWTDELAKAKINLENLDAVELQKLIEAFARGKDVIHEAAEEEKTFGENSITAAQGMQNVNSELDHFKSRIAYFFGATNAVNLFKRALQSAFATVKDLDKVMTETAVVTKFDVGQMWEQLPEYTKRANELGVTIHDAYEAATIYYQQGLETNQVMEVSNQTLKMARIAGLDAAEATDRMTNALRGFNMEINEMNAERVADVYSKLAAMSASNVDEISTAMTKVASLASNANMEFETTAAFLAQMIETTRESAETAGTALKTVIARFSEVKNLYSKGELLGTDEEGEAIDVNKVSKALRSVGVNLNEYLTGMKGLDDIFIELASKWDSLDRIQQRYIATMAAGSRQQSRFIAMMQDYARTQELVGAAETANGAAQAQYEKTLESLETKLNRLKNAWDEFVMSIANNKIIKGVVDLLTGFISAINKLTSSLPGVLNGISKLGLAFGAFKLGKNVFNKGLAQAGQIFFKGTSEIADKGGSNFINTFRASLEKNQGGIKGLFAPVVDGFQGTLQDVKRNVFNDLRDKGLGDVEAGRIASMFDGTKEGAEAAKRALDEAKVSYDKYDEATKNAAAAQANFQKRVSTTAATIGAVGASILILSQLLPMLGVKNEKLSKTLVTVGMSLVFVATILPTLSKAAQAFGNKLAEAGIKAQISWGWIGLLLAALTALVILTIKVAQNADTAEHRFKKLQEETERIAEAAKEAAEQYAGLKEALDALKDKTSALDGLIEGTQEWKEAVFQVNQQVLGLLQNYPKLAKYIHNENGVLTVDWEGAQEVLLEYEKTAERASKAEAFTTARREKAKGVIDQNGLRSKVGFAIDEDKIKYDPNEVPQQYVERVYGALEEAAKEIASGKGYKDEQKYTDYVEEVTKKYGIILSGTGDALDENINALKSYGEALLEGEITFEGLLEVIGDVSAAYPNEKEAIKTFVDGELVNSVLKEASEKYYTQLSDTEKQRYNKYFQDVYGATNISSSGVVTKKNGEKIDASDAMHEYAGAFAEDLVKDFIKDFQEAISGDSNIAKLVKSFYEEGTGANFTKTDLDFIEKNGGAEGILEELGITDKNSELYNKILNELNKGIVDSEEAFKNMDSKIRQLGFTTEDVVGKLDGLTGEAISNFIDNIQEINTESGQEAGAIIKDQYNAIARKLTTEDIPKLGAALSRIDWDDINSVKQLPSILEELGINSKDVAPEVLDLIESIIKLGNASYKVSGETAANITKASGKVLSRLKSGDNSRVFSEEDYNALKGIVPELSTQFKQDADGNWIYLGNSMSELEGAIEKNTLALLDSTKSQLQNKIEGANSWENVLKSDSENAGYAEEGYVGNQRALVDTFIKENAGKLSGLGIENLNDNMESTDGLANTVVTQIYNDLINNLNEREANKAGIKAIDESFSLSGASADEVAARQGSDEDIRMAVRQDAQTYGLNPDDVINFSNALQQQNENLRTNQELADIVALSNSKMNQGLSELISSYKDWTPLIDESGKLIKSTSAEDTEAINKFKASVNKMLNTTEDLSDAFYDNAENMENIKKAAEGDTKALGALQKAAADDYLVQIQTELDGDAYDAVEDFRDYLANTELPELEPGVDMSQVWDGAGEFIDAFNQMVATANFSAEQIQEAARRMGFDAEVIYVTQTRKLPRYSQTEKKTENPDGTTTIESGTPVITGYDYVTGEFPVVKTLTSIGSGGGGVSVGNQNAGAGNRPSGGGGGGGGGGKAEKPTYWENPYDELYNLTEKINEALRTRAALERRYQKIAKLGVTTAGEMRKAFTDQIEQLQYEIELQKQLQAGRLRQIQNVGNEIYTDKEGNRSTFSQLGVTRYASYNKDTGLIQIDWNAIDAVSRDPNRSEEGEAIEAYISKLEELVEGYEDVRDTIWDMEDELEDIIQQSIDDYLDFESRVYDAMVAAREKEIEAYGALSDAIQDSTSRVLNKMQEQIESERQARENDKTEEEIADREARLAYLSRDTSGANQMEIMKLQQEIDDARQSYTDALIDQAIQEMQKDADKAAEQREQQQALLEAQLKFDEEQGIIMAQVEEILRNSFSDDQAVAMSDEELKNLLQDNEAFKNMSLIGKEEWLRGFIESWNKAQSGYKADEEKKKAEEAAVAAAQSTTSSTPTTTTPSQPAASTPKYPLPLSDDTAKGIATSICFVSGGGGWGNWPDRENRLVAKFGNGAYWKVQQYVEQIVAAGWSNLWGKDGRKYTYASFKTGGLADFTGPAWLDGSRSHPEMVLNAADTENLIMLKDILNSILKRTSNAFGTAASELNFDIDINADLSSDYDVEQLADKVKGIIYDEAMYKNVNTVNRLR